MHIKIGARRDGDSLAPAADFAVAELSVDLDTERFGEQTRKLSTRRTV